MSLSSQNKTKHTKTRKIRLKEMLFGKKKGLWNVLAFQTSYQHKNLAPSLGEFSMIIA